jgi:hypothetical protein
MYERFRLSLHRIQFSWAEYQDGRVEIERGEMKPGTQP